MSLHRNVLLNVIRVIRKMKKEAAIHMGLRHANIVIMLGTIFEDRNYGLVLEYVEFGSLEKFLSKKIRKSGLFC